MKTSGILGAILLLCASTTFAQSSQDKNGKFSGVLFSDYYWVAASHDDNIEGENGFWFRRVYFTYDRQLTDAFSARFRLEGSSPGDFSSSQKISPVVKDLYLRWQNEQHQIEAGMSSTPTWGLVEDVWGYRSVEKTPLDMQNFASSRDIGLSFEGELDEEGRVDYHFMLGNGNSNKSEFNKGKKIMFSIAYEVSEHIVVEAYADYNDNTDQQDWMTLQGFAGYQSDDFNLGVLFAAQKRENATDFTTGDPVDLNLEIASVFTRFSLSEKANGFLRIDHTFDAIPDVDDNDYFPMSNQAASTVFIAGLDFNLDHNIHLMPNIEAAVYDDSELTGAKPEADFMPRLTLAYSF